MLRISKRFLGLACGFALAGTAALGCSDQESDGGDGGAAGSDHMAGSPGSAGASGVAGTSTPEPGGSAGEGGGGSAGGPTAGFAGSHEAGAAGTSQSSSSGSPSDGGAPTADSGGAPSAGAAGTEPAGSGGTEGSVQLIGYPVESHPDIPIPILQSMNCLQCHANPEEYPDAPQFLMGGTVFTSAGEPAGGSIVSAVTDGVQLLAIVGPTGLFRVVDDGSVDFDWASATVMVTLEDSGIAMPGEATGGCNSCHTGETAIQAH